ncbi:MAG: ADP-ribosylglycohydrolase family protein [Thiothrix sp.]|uniref:ADP-ribosylglycohydrolase family protein n=1 Tax=Thiothrix sp. TaxID=1032 RepID=UPI0026221486|nr:ADP-ribosylglycohydrolase family protein [Thiothrix sp.]MDD5393512.1 ADP-ribosylglycohydrolase family protein [Thiothrix sp.]
MLGAIAGDIIGSVFEARNWRNEAPHKSKDFPLFDPKSKFTDDSVLTIALADAILHQRDYAEVMREYYQRYTKVGFGKAFRVWGATPDAPAYNSWGNGSAMRISPVGYAFDSLEAVLVNARRYSEPTHNHPEGVKGAQAVASVIYLARKGADKAELKRFVEREFGYDLSRTLDDIRPDYAFNESCQQTVPEAITAFLEANDFEDTIRNAISLGGDSDTLACIAGSMAEAFYGGVPAHIAAPCLALLDEPLRNVTQAFRTTYHLNA